MPANTHGADINELGLGYFLNGETWFDEEARRQHAIKKAMVSKEEFVAQMSRAAVMAEAVRAHLKVTYPRLKIVAVYWTARPGSLAKAVGRDDVDSRKNPTDILLKLTGSVFLGLSAKSTQGKADIGFKNPGLGTIETALKIPGKLRAMLAAAEKACVKRFKLPEVAAQRKLAIRAKPTIQAVTQAMGSKTLEVIRDEVLKAFKRLPAEKLRQHLLTEWMDASEGVYPPYVKVTGYGNKDPYTAKVENPQSNYKLTALMREPIVLGTSGATGITVMAGSTRILKIRAKFASEPLASPIKFTADPF